MPPDKTAMPNVADFRSLILRSGLVSPAAVDSWWREHDCQPHADAKEIADLLVADGLLTAWQANKLLSGKWKGFFVDNYRLDGFVRADEGVSYFSAVETTSGARVVLEVDPSSRGLREDRVPQYTVHPAE